MKKNRFKKVVVIVLLSLIFTNFTLVKSFAHDAYFFQVLIDENTMTYLGNIVPDRASTFSWEKKHIEPQLWDVDKFVEKAKNRSLTLDYEQYEGISDGKNSMAFTFPSKEIREPTNHVTAKDIDRAYEIRDTLIPNLNEILIIINDSKSFKTLNELISASEAVCEGREYNGWNISYSGNYIDISKSGNKHTFLAKMTKGYNSSTLENGKESPLYDSDLDYSDDVEYITIPMIIVQGNYTCKVKGHLAENAGEYTKPGTLERKLSEFLTSAINGIRSLLGLYNLNEIIYNEGTRDVRSFYGGIMSHEWMEKTTTFHMIFQALAWMILIIAILKILIQRNFTTVYINPAVKTTLMDTLKDMLITGFMLVSSFVLLNTLLKLNKKVVDIFATTIPNYSGFTGMSSDYQTFAGCFLQIYYLIITIYMNLTYIIRGIVVAILIASAPLFIVSIVFEGKNKKLFSVWLRELLANIFLQSFHAFVLSFLLNIQMSTRGIELAIISFALIPLTRFFRELITGQGGGVAGHLGIQSVTAGASAIGGAIEGTFGRGGRGKIGDIQKLSKSSGFDSNIKTKDSSDIPGSRENPERKEHSANIPTKEETSSALGSMERKYSGQPQTLDRTEDTNYEKLSNKFGQNNESNNVKDSIKDVRGAISTTALGAGKVALGASAVMALGGQSNQGISLMESGMSNIGYGGKKIGSNIISGATKTSINALNSLKSEEGNILGAEKTSSGNVVVHRDKSMLEKDGLESVRKTGEGNIAITYNRDKLSMGNKENLAKIESMYKDKDNYLKERGIEKVAKNQRGNTVVHFNQYGQENLGFKDMYQTKNRIVETKSPEQPLNTNLLYDVEKIKPTPPKSIVNK